MCQNTDFTFKGLDLSRVGAQPFSCKTREHMEITTCGPNFSRVARKSVWLNLEAEAGDVLWLVPVNVFMRAPQKTW